MAQIVFAPGEFNSNPSNVVQHSDFENDFQVTQNGNEYSFTGSWFCPADFPTQYHSILDVSPTSNNIVALTLEISVTNNTQAGEISGKFWVNSGDTALSKAGISHCALEALKNGASVNVTNKDTGIGAPFMLANISMENF